MDVVSDEGSSRALIAAVEVEVGGRGFSRVRAVVGRVEVVEVLECRVQSK